MADIDTLVIMPNLRDNLSLTSKQRRSVFSGVLLDKGGKITQDNTDLTVGASDSKDRAAPDYLKGVFLEIGCSPTIIGTAGNLPNFGKGSM